MKRRYKARAVIEYKNEDERRKARRDAVARWRKRNKRKILKEKIKRLGDSPETEARIHKIELEIHQFKLDFEDVCKDIKKLSDEIKWRLK